jgi:hypothetical protein
LWARRGGCGQEVSLLTGVCDTVRVLALRDIGDPPAGPPGQQ